MTTARRPEGGPSDHRTEQPPARRRGALGRLAAGLWLLYTVVGGLAVTALLVTVVADVLLRYLFNSGIAGANDIVSSWFMTTVAFTGIALAQRTGGRIQVDFVMDAVPGRLRQLSDVVVLLAVAALGALFAWYGWTEALDQMEAGEYAPIGDRPLWPFRFLVPIGFAGFTLACLLSAADTVRRGPIETPAMELDTAATDNTATTAAAPDTAPRSS